jgi:hypothetical protein
MNYTITQLIDKFDSNYIAYCTHGSCKGGFIFCDKEDNNKLKSMYPEGFVSENFIFRIRDDITIEEGTEWIFMHEQSGERLKELNLELAKVLIVCSRNGYEFVDVGGGI